MAVRKNRAAKAQSVFRWTVSVVTVLVVARVLQDWFHVRELLRQQAAKAALPSFVSYVIVHTNSSLRTHICRVAVVALGAPQIFLVWRLRQPRRWWQPPAIELAIELILSVLFSIAAAQVLGHYLSGCEGGDSNGDSNYRCVVQLPLILHDGWVALFAVVGIGIGLLWFWTARISSETTAHDSRTPSEVNSTAA
jgi:hypothetical protein